MTKQLSVLMISSWYPSRINPTLGNFVEKFGESIAMFHKVTVIHVVADHNMEKAYEYVRKKNKSMDIYIVYFRKKKKELFIDKTVKTFRFFKHYLRVYKLYTKEHGKPDIVHHNILFPVGIIALLFKKIYKIPYVVSEHWTGYLPSNYISQSLFVKWLSRIIAKNASALLPVSLDLKNAMIRQGFDNKYFVVHNVIDAGQFNLPLIAKEKQKKTIVHVSSLKDDHKNITGILNVIKRIRGLREDFELQIVSDGDAAPHKNYANKLGLLNKVVFFHGTMTPGQIAEIMKQSDFFLLFSNYENLPCVIVEALASGLPVVSSTAGGIPEHITEDKGILVEPGDENALFEACLRMLDNCRSFNKKKLHDYAVANFSYESVGKKLSNIYYSILKY